MDCKTIRLEIEHKEKKKTNQGFKQVKSVHIMEIDFTRVTDFLIHLENLKLNNSIIGVISTMNKHWQD